MTADRLYEEFLNGREAYWWLQVDRQRFKSGKEKGYENSQYDAYLIREGGIVKLDCVVGMPSDGCASFAWVTLPYANARSMINIENVLGISLVDENSPLRSVVSGHKDNDGQFKYFVDLFFKDHGQGSIDKRLKCRKMLDFARLFKERTGLVLTPRF